MIRSLSVPFPLARAIALVALAGMLAARSGAEESNPAPAAPAPSPATSPAITSPADGTAPSTVSAATAAPVSPAGPAVAAASPDSAAPVAGLSSAKAESAPAAELLSSSGPAVPMRRGRDEVHGLLNLGANLTNREQPDYDAAEIAYRQVLNSPDAGPNEIKSALLGMAHMHRKKGELTKAVAIYERYLADYPSDERGPDALLDLGRTLREMGAYKLAISRFYNVINSTMKLPGEGFERYRVLAKTAAFEIAETHYQAGEYAEASKFYMKFRLLDLSPADRARAHFKMAKAMKLQGDLEGTVTTLRAYIEQWPDDENIPEARYMLATTLRELKRPQEAFAATLDLLRTEKDRVATAPKRWSYWQRKTGNQIANEFFESGDILNAHAIYTRLLELGPELAWRLPIRYQIGLCYERLGISDKARTTYQAIVDEAGANPPAEFAELVHMAGWRIEHLLWRDKVAQDINKIFETTTGKQASLPAPAPKAAATP
jgi:tetratricopeptide (TPR) repeat protein